MGRPSHRMYGHMYIVANFSAINNLIKKIKMKALIPVT